MAHSGENVGGRRRVLGIYTLSLVAESLQDLSKISCLAEAGRGPREEEERREEHNAREDRETLSPSPLPHRNPSQTSSRSHRNLGGFSLFLASRACENSSVRGTAIAARRVVEDDVQEASYTARII